MDLDSSVTTCSDGILAVSITGETRHLYNYNWYLNDSLGGPDVLVSQSQTVDQLNPGTYWLEASDANGCLKSDILLFLLWKIYQLQSHLVMLHVTDSKWNYNCNCFKWKPCLYLVV